MVRGLVDSGHPPTRLITRSIRNLHRQDFNDSCVTVLIGAVAVFYKTPSDRQHRLRGTLPREGSSQMNVLTLRLDATAIRATEHSRSSRRLWRLFLIMCMVALVPDLHAAGQYNGCGIGVADSNGWNGWADPPTNTVPRPLPVENQAFTSLQTRIFRATVYLDAADHEIGGVARQIDNARQRGVTDVTVTFDIRKNTVPPDVGTYRNQVIRIINTLGARVTRWGTLNEPNAGRNVLPGYDGARKLAGYYTQLRSIVPWHQLMGPDFHDQYQHGVNEYTGDASTAFLHYLYYYWIEGGGFGSAAAWHPYGDVQRLSTAATRHYVSIVQSWAPGTPIFVTEAGAIKSLANAHGEIVIFNDEEQQAIRANHLLYVIGNEPWIARVYYYHIQQGDGDYRSPHFFDAAFLRRDGTARPTYTSLWIATHLQADFKPVNLSPAGNFPGNTPFNFTFSATPRHWKRVNLWVHYNGAWHHFAGTNVAPGNNHLPSAGFPRGYWWYWNVTELDDCDWTWGPASDNAVVYSY